MSTYPLVPNDPFSPKFWDDIADMQDSEDAGITITLLPTREYNGDQWLIRAFGYEIAALLPYAHIGAIIPNDVPVKVIDVKDTNEYLELRVEAV